MQPRKHRMLAALAATPQGLTIAALTEITDPTDAGKVGNNASEICALKHKGCVDREGSLWRITAKGREELRLRDCGEFGSRRRRPELEDRRMGRQLADSPVIVHVPASSVRAPRGLVNSAFAMGAAA